VRKLAVTAIAGPDNRHGYIGSLVASGDRVFAVGGTHHRPTCLVSEDRGRSFAAWTPPSAPGLRDVHVDGDTVWVVGEWGLIARTTDGGATWTRSNRSSETGCLYVIDADRLGRKWVLGDRGLVLRASRNGKKFVKVDNRSTHRMLYLLLEGNDVWILDSGGMLQRNRGRGFEEVRLAAMRTARPLCALIRSPARTLLLLGDRGLILRSSNDGASWKKISIASRNDLEKIAVTRYGIFVVGDAGSLLVSHDDGRSFQGLDTAMTDHLWSILAIDGDLLIGGNHGQIWRIARRDLAELLCEVHTERDPVLAGLAARLRDGDIGADLVLEDALRERELW